MSDKSLHLALLLGILLVFSWSVIDPHDLFTWFLEVFPAIIGIGALLTIYPRFQFTNVTYLLIFIHAIILIIGGHYTYAKMPLFTWLQDVFHLERNYYDRLGHFAQGFIPAIITREILFRTSPLRSSKWLAPLVICVCLALSASYELLEFAVALATGTAAEAFLGTQGDVWDTQWDMLFALIGAISALLTLSKIHDQQLSFKKS